MSAKHFHSPCEKRFRRKRFDNFIRKSFIVVPVAVQNSLEFRDGSIEVVGNVMFVRIQSIRVVIMLTVDVHFNIGKVWVQNVIYKSNERNRSLLRRLFLFRLCLFFVLLFYFLLLWFCKFRNHNPWQVSLSKPSTSVPNQRNSSDPFESQTLCSFHQVR